MELLALCLIDLWLMNVLEDYSSSLDGFYLPNVDISLFICLLFLGFYYIGEIAICMRCSLLVLIHYFYDEFTMVINCYL